MPTFHLERERPLSDISRDVSIPFFHCNDADFFLTNINCFSGFGKSKGRLNVEGKGRFLANLINAIESEKRPILVSPSMSGSYSLDLIFSFDGKNISFCIGFLNP